METNQLKVGVLVAFLAQASACAPVELPLGDEGEGGEGPTSTGGSSVSQAGVPSSSGGYSMGGYSTGGYSTGGYSMGGYSMGGYSMGGSTASGGATPVGDCYGPHDSPELALEPGSIGCPCDFVAPTCVAILREGRYHQLSFQCGGELRWESVEDGVCADTASCKVEGTVYPTGAAMPDPFSCNTCTCEDGQLGDCTEIGCEETCPEGTVAATGCAECGPTDRCLVVEIGCFPLEEVTCTSDRCFAAQCG